VRDLDETLRWAQRRANELIETISDDSELLALIRKPTAAAASAPRPGRAAVEPPSEAAEPGQDPPIVQRTAEPPAPVPEPEAPAVEPDAPTPAPATPIVAAAQPVANATAVEAARVVEPTAPARTQARRIPPPPAIAPVATSDTTVTTSARAGSRVPAADAAQPPDEAARTPAPEPPPSTPQTPRREVRYSLMHPVEINTPTWSDFIELCTKDISRGGMFVQSAVAPKLMTRVTVRVELPANAGNLKLSGETVHIVTPAQSAATGATAGFGVQFGPMTPERRKMLETLLDHARTADGDAHPPSGPNLEELGFRCSSGTQTNLRLTLSESELLQVQALRSELASMSRKCDLKLLGVTKDAELDEIRAAFAALAEQWRPRVDGKTVSPEVRTIATEIYLRLQSAFRRLSDPRRLAHAASPATSPGRRSGTTVTRSERPRRKASQGASQAGTGPEPSPSPAPRADAAQPDDADSNPIPTEDAAPNDPERPARPTSQRSRLFLRQLVAHGTKLTSQLAPASPARPAPAAPGLPGVNHLMGQAYEALSEKRYADAEDALREAMRMDPNHSRAQILLHLTRARQSVAKRNYDEARAQYEALLRLDPENRFAKRELLMVSALQ